ncbi:hypothetical protein HH304_05585 [Flammeovirgaceae bacterium KN852]|uniref:Uncharacterized protein n=2 Tax=Marinigracilibium pacificum TaxID=2729599 RepID=A0A848ITP9_9BACT|nr:hypothetical protein [Marinigracilibium pacificum]
MLDEELNQSYSKHKPAYLKPSEAEENGKLGSNLIIKGIPKKIDSGSQFSAFIMVPIATGNVTTFTMIPIFENYDVYEIKDDNTSEKLIIAHDKRTHRLPEEEVTIGGVLKEFAKENKNSKDKSVFLEVLYHLN